MDLFNIVFILSIRCTTDYFSSNEILMFENNYWKENINQVKTYKGSLEYVILRIVDKKYSFHFSKCLLNNCHYDSDKKKHYFILCPCHSKYIFHKFDKGEQVILRSTYTYSYTTHEKLPKSNRVKKYRYDNFKILIKDNDNIIKLGNDDLIAYQSHIKDFFSRFINSGCIIAENFKSVLEDDFLETTPKFVLYHFDSLSSCLESYKKFMEHCNFLNLVDDNRNLRFKFRTNSNNIFKASKLKKHLDYYFENDFKIKKKYDFRYHELKNWINHLFKKCCNELEENILENKIVLPFNKDFNTSYYFEKFYCFIENVLNDMLEKFDPLSLNYKKNYISYITNFLNKLNEMSKEIVNNAWDSLKVVKFFSKEFKRDIKELKDFIEIDKLMCDYHNMICCVFASRDGLNFSELEFKHPRFKDNYECRILKGFEIIFDRSKNKTGVKLDKPVLFQAVKALDTENYEHCLEIDIDYFLYFFENGFSVRFTLEKIKEKKIKKIQVVTTNEQFNKVFKVLLKE